MGIRYMIYIAWNKDKYLLELSHDPVLDLSFHMEIWGCQQLWILTPPILLGQAYYILNSVASQQERKGVTFSYRDSSFKNIAKYFAEKIPFAVSHGNQLKEKYAMVQNYLVKLDIDELDEPQLITCSDVYVNRIEISKKQQEAQEILSCLEGRYILADEVDALLNYSKISVENPLEDLLQILSLQHKVEIFPGVGLGGKKSRLKCFRCDSSENLKQSYCLECGANNCYYCENCISMGESRECMQLYGFPDYSKPVSRQVEVHFEFELTPAQKDAAVNVWNFTKNSKLDKSLVWAACGAGKTEVSFPSIANVLKKGHKVLFAVPRKDTIIDIEKRVRKCFSGIEIAALYGGSSEKFKDADLILATTHQVLRFYEAFHLVVLDEVDAFPYHGSSMLYNALNRALHPEGKIIYMTATPPPYLLKMDKNVIEIVTIPARHHGYPLPVPEIVVDRNLQLKDNELFIPEKVLKFLHESIEGDFSQIFIFVPTIFLSEKVGAMLKKAFELPPFNNFGGSWVNYTHSQDPERDKKRESFLNGDFPVLVTTTLMERGINVPKVNVIVLFAENQYIFDTASLVQMAGRTGRMTESPTGKVWFVGAQNTSFMKQAVSWIKDINKRAADMGYLKRFAFAKKMGMKNVK